MVLFFKKKIVKHNSNISVDGGCHNSVDLSAPTILRSLVQISSTPTMPFPFIVKFCTIFVIVLRKERK